MAHSQNGWPVVGKSACDQGPFQGVTFPNGILAGDVATIARWQLARYEELVEPLKAGTCWGWYVKDIEGSSVISNHSSATAWDINADRHAMGSAPSRSMSQRQIDACHHIERESDGVLRWGGDFSRPDPMHWEIIGSKTQAKMFAGKIRAGQAPGGDGSGEDMLVKKGDSGEEVKFWQFLLEELGYDVGTVDGQYGPKMDAAVNKYRKDHGQGVVGYISGWQGWSMLRDQAKKYAGKNGVNGKDGAPGKPGADGKDGTLSGTLEVLGGSLQVKTGG